MMKNRVYIFLSIFIIQFTWLTAQTRTDALKNQAVNLMREGRYKEAIDQLNKFISANPQQATGYHLRGLSYEKTTEYQYSVLDLRRANRLEPNNVEISKDLNRVISIWHQQLYQKIEGHKRDIAIDPNYPFSYLEIGQSYRWLEEWNLAEIWYDEYLKRDDNASPDEIIRYTEILAKTGSITKGERILKIFVERYPNDWRLWSRYGYFTLWLGKQKIAEDAFQKALGFKPFFKEAEDGLDLARNQAYLTLYQPRAYERVYPIDRYYRIVGSQPENDEARFNLIDELMKADRYEEAYQQLQFLQNRYSQDERFISYQQIVAEYRDSTFNRRIDEYSGVLKEEPNNKEAVQKLAESYANLFYYDSAIEVLTEYLADKPDDQDIDIRFIYAKYSAWNYEWEKSIAQLNKLLELDPGNIDYQLLRGQIGVWTVLDFEISEYYLLNVIRQRPDELAAYLALASLYSWEKDFDEAKKYLDIAKTISPTNPEVESAQSNYEIHLSAYEEQKVFELKGEAGRLAIEGRCNEAKKVFEEYFSKRTGPTRDELSSYADILSCAQDYGKAIQVYDQLLNEAFDYRIALNRAKNYYYNQESDRALIELEALHQMNPDDDEAEMFLADAYAITGQPFKAEEIYRKLKAGTEIEQEKRLLNQRMAVLGDYFVRENELDKANNLYKELLKENSDDEELIQDINTRRIFLGDAYSLREEWRKADNIYDDILDRTRDTSEIRMLKQRIDWIPPYGLRKGLISIGNFLGMFFPTNIGLTPFGNYYMDNQDLSFINYGFRADLGMFGFLSLGGTWARTRINTELLNREITSLKATASIYIAKGISLSGSYGTMNTIGEHKKNIGDITFRIEEPEYYYITAYYENSDARLLLYSPTLINTRYKAELYRIAGSYTYRDAFRVSAQYGYYSLSDANYGNDFQFRLARKFFTDTYLGYEYYFSDFAFVSPLYYSPQDFDSHSLWGEYLLQPEKNLKIKMGGKIGYVTAADFILSEIYAEANYKLLEVLMLNGRIGLSNSFRYDTSYKSLSAYISAYLSIY